jgi:TPR repeat protein
MLKFPYILFFLFSMPAFADFDAGKQAYDKKEWAVAIQELRPLAEAGDERALIILGNMYTDGLGVVANPTEGMKLYKRAAIEKNNSQAMCAVGAMYVSAVGVDQNLAMARDWFKRSAMLGDPRGAFFYATILFSGNKTPPNELEPDLYNAYKWFKIAATETQSPSVKTVAQEIADGIAKKFLKPEEIVKADKEVVDWKPVKSEELGPPPQDLP